MIRVRELLGTHDVAFVTLDTLRYDVAQKLFEEGGLPELARLLAPSGWEKRHSPGSFTYPAHAAFFAGFLPTPATPGPHPRPFALAFPGSETIGPGTVVFEAANIVQGFADAGYHTICVGGVGFFNRLTPLARVFPDMFRESHWSPELGVTDPNSTERQVRLALDRIADIPPPRRVFLFLNVSAIHQPNRFYLPGSGEDTIYSHAAALAYVDAHLGTLFRGLRRRAPVMAVVCSDHGTAYGEGGFNGHRLAHPVVWEVPYAEFILDQEV